MIIILLKFSFLNIIINDTIETILTFSVITWGCTSLMRGNLRTYQRIPK